MNDILNGKYLIHFNRTTGKIYDLAKLITPIYDGVYYATLLDASTGELVEATKGLVSFGDEIGASDYPHFIFDDAEDLKKLLVKLNVIAASEEKKHLFMLSDMLKDTPAIEGK